MFTFVRYVLHTHTYRLDSLRWLHLRLRYVYVGYHVPVGCVTLVTTVTFYVRLRWFVTFVRYVRYVTFVTFVHLQFVTFVTHLITVTFVDLIRCYVYVCCYVTFTTVHTTHTRLRSFYIRSLPILRLPTFVRRCLFTLVGYVTHTHRFVTFTLPFVTFLVTTVRCCLRTHYGYVTCRYVYVWLFVGWIMPRSFVAGCYLYVWLVIYRYVVTFPFVCCYVTLLRWFPTVRYVRYVGSFTFVVVTLRSLRYYVYILHYVAVIALLRSHTTFVPRRSPVGYLRLRLRLRCGWLLRLRLRSLNVTFTFVTTLRYTPHVYLRLRWLLRYVYVYSLRLRYGWLRYVYVVVTLRLRYVYHTTRLLPLVRSFHVYVRSLPRCTFTFGYRIWLPPRWLFIPRVLPFG